MRFLLLGVVLCFGFGAVGAGLSYGDDSQPSCPVPPALPTGAAPPDAATTLHTSLVCTVGAQAEPCIGVEACHEAAPLPFRKATKGFLTRPLRRNRLYLARNYGQTTGWNVLLSAASRRAVRLNDFSRSALLAIFRRGYLDVSLTFLSRAGAMFPAPDYEMWLRLVTSNPLCAGAPPAPDTGAHSCGGRAGGPNFTGCYEIVAVPRDDTAYVDALVVSQEILSAA